MALPISAASWDCKALLLYCAHLASGPVKHLQFSLSTQAADIWIDRQAADIWIGPRLWPCWTVAVQPALGVGRTLWEWQPHLFGKEWSSITAILIIKQCKVQSIIWKASLHMPISFQVRKHRYSRLKTNGMGSGLKQEKVSESRLDFPNMPQDQRQGFNSQK